MPDDPAAVPTTRVLSAVTGGRYELPVYPFVEPAELKGKLGRHAVVIVGAGLAGLAAACDLSVRGVPAVVLDEDDTVGVRGAASRAICYGQKSLEYLQRLGVYERVADKGVAWSVARTFAGAQEIGCVDARALPGHALSRQPPFINLQQFFVEWFLVDRIYELGVVDLRWKTRVTGVTPHADHVEVHVATPSGQYTLDCGWLIDCSGQRSPLRQWIGVDLQASGALDRWCVCDLRLAQAAPAERRTWIEAPFNGDRAACQQPLADGLWRLDYQVAEGDAEAVSVPERVRERLIRQFGDDVQHELLWIAVHDYRSECLAHFRAGRVFFAGDAAHVMSPYDARGGNAALQDVENLVWKLSLVLFGKAPEALLDSYDAERRPAALRAIASTERTARFLAPRSPVQLALRAATLALAREHAFARRLVDVGELAGPAGYDPSPLSIDGWPSRPVQNVALQLPDGRAGDLVSLLQQVDPALLGVVRGPPAAPVPQLTRELPERYPVRFVRLQPSSAAPGALPAVVDGSGALARQLGLDDDTVTRIAVVRPDLYRAGLLREPDAPDVERAVRGALGLGGSER